MTSAMSGDDLYDALIGDGTENVRGRQITVGVKVWKHLRLCLQLWYLLFTGPFWTEKDAGRPLTLGFRQLLCRFSVPDWANLCLLQ